jgi:hypothetical protein
MASTWSMTPLDLSRILWGLSDPPTGCRGRTIFPFVLFDLIDPIAKVHVLGKGSPQDGLARERKPKTAPLLDRILVDPVQHVVRLTVSEFKSKSHETMNAFPTILQTFFSFVF